MSILKQSKEEMLEIIRKNSVHKAMGSFPVMGSLSEGNYTQTPDNLSKKDRATIDAVKDKATYPPEEADLW